MQRESKIYKRRKKSQVKESEKYFNSTNKRKKFNQF